MRAIWTTAVLTTALLAGCGRDMSGAASSEAAVSPAAAPSPLTARQGDAAAGSPIPAATGQTAPAPVQALPMLAFAYTATLEAPNDAVTALMLRHEQACAQAGPAVCQVTSAESSTDRENQEVRGRLTLRAQPQWLSRFRAGLHQDARGAGGRLTGGATETEDLTRSIVDTEAYLRAKTALRDRLQQLLETRSASVADLVQLERSLAEVQGEIDAANSQLQVMRTRVATSTLTLNYQSTRSAVAGGVWRPVAEASQNFFGVFAWAVAAIIVLVAALVPFALIAVPIGWLIVRSRRRAKARRAAAAPTTASPPA